MEEVWKPVLNYEDLYEISNLGRIKTLARDVYYPGDKNRKPFIRRNKEKIMKQTYYGTPRKYLAVKLTKNQNPKNFLVHRLVAETFIGAIPEDMEVNHKDEIKTNNNVENLEIVTCKENIQKARNNNKIKPHRRCKYKLTNVETNEEMIFNSSVDLAKHINRTDVAVRQYADGIYNNLILEI